MKPIAQQNSEDSANFDSVPQKSASGLLEPFWLNPALTNDFKEEEVSTLISHALRQDDQQAVQHLLHFIANHPGLPRKDFFKDAAVLLQELLKVNHVVIANREEKDLQALAFICNNRSLEKQTLPQQNSPFEEVFTRGSAFYIRHLAEKFPNTPLVISLGVDSIIGLPLQSATNQPIGLIAVMHNAPLLRPEFFLKVLRVIIPRLQRELEQYRKPKENPDRSEAIIEKRTRELNQTRSLLNSVLRVSSQAFLILDPGLKVSFYNEHFLGLWGIAEEDMVLHEHDLFNFLTGHLIITRDLKKLHQQLGRNTSTYTDIPIHLRSGKHLLMSIYPQFDKGELLGQIVSFCEQNLPQ